MRAKFIDFNAFYLIWAIKRFTKFIMKSNFKISIIVPVYNTEQHLRKCIDSILNQSIKTFELILINDGSTDNSLAICEEFKAKDTRIIVISQENQGPSEARNKGIRIATGSYITGIDSDDWVEQDYLKNLLDISLKYEADIAISELSSEERKEEFLFSQKITILNSANALNALYTNKFIRDHFCGKLFKKELFEHIKFPKNKYFEDIFIMYRLFAQAKKIVKTEIASYHYISHPNSISSFSQKSSLKFSNWNEALLMQFYFLKAHPDKFSDPNAAYSATAVNFYRLKKVMMKTLPWETKERKKLEKEINQSLEKALKEASAIDIGVLRYFNCLLVLHLPIIFYAFRRLIGKS